MSLSTSPIRLAIDAYNDLLLLHECKYIVSSLIIFGALIMTLKPMQISVFLCSPKSALQEQDQSSSSFEMAQRVMHHRWPFFVLVTSLLPRKLAPFP